MPVRIAKEITDRFRINKEIVGGMRIAGEIAYQLITANTQEIMLPGSIFLSSSPVILWRFNRNLPQIDSALTPGSDRYLNLVRFFSDGRVELQFDPTPSFTNSRADLSDKFETSGSFTVTSGENTLTVQMAGSDLSEPYQFTPANSSEVITFYNALRTQSNVAATLTLSDGAGPSPEPPTPTNIAEFTLNAVAIGGSGAAGRFSGLTWNFTHEGQTYRITSCFTHGNGIQMRFQTNAEALAFIAADFTIDPGISGQQPFKSSQMSNDSTRMWAQYAAYPGRFIANTDYTISIKE